MNMNRLITPAATVATAVALAACGSSSSGSSGAATAAASNGGSTAVSVRQLSGVGSVLVDQSGKPLYSSDLEASGKIVCDTAACNAFWKPLTTGGGKPTASADAGKLGVTTRPDGKKQITANGRPLYTFVEDSPGKATGNGFKDDFGGHHFTWNVVHAGGKTTSGGNVGATSTTASPSYNNGY